ncbi:MAG: TetR/AcrR family transcriptional regulator [Spirochaetota bacterium]
MEGFTIRQKELIDASIKIIAEKGIQHLTIKNLSSLIGISEPAIYRHFPSKMDILLAILHYFELEQVNLFNRITAAREPALRKLELMFHCHFQKLQNNPALAAVIFSEQLFQNDNRLSGKVLKLMDVSQKFLNRIIDEGTKKNEIRTDISKEYVSTIIMGSLRLLVTRWYLSGFSFELESKGKKLWQSIKKAMRK